VPAFFPIYVAAVVLAAIVLVLGLSHIDPHRLADHFAASTPTRLIGAALVFVGAGLASVWLAMWAAFVFAGRVTPIAPEAFKVVAALDLCLMVPALIAGGVLTWKRRPWGFVIATLASIQGALYLLVLATNTLVLIQRGLARSPGELPIWGPLTVVMAAVTVLLMKNVQARSQR
jgi:hypothetical protein